jgi:outer membrane protein assembly factor BamB
MKKLSLRFSLCLALSALCTLSVATAQPADAIRAARILDATGVQGGLIVQIGCGDGKLTAALHANESYLVHGLDTSAENVRRAREYIQSLGLYGKVAVEQFDGKKLPYVDNLVNLVVAEDLGDVPTSEVMRVLCPKGVAYIKKNGEWKKTVKPRPKGIDDWTHYLYDASNNAVSHDQIVGPPRHFQWIGKPRFARSHDQLASVSAVVSSGGRVFYIVDTGSTAFVAAPSRWRLVARDAFNGVKLWERKIPKWEYHLRDFRSGPADIARRLVAVGDRVYVTLGYGQPVSALDAATGRTVLTYAGTDGTREILHYHDMLLLVLGKPDKNWQAEKAKEIASQPGYHPPFEKDSPPAYEKSVMAVDAGTGELRWKIDEPYTHNLMPSTLTASGSHVYFQDPNAIFCLDAATGKLQWKDPRPIQRLRLAWSTPTLVAYKDMVFSADRGAAMTKGSVLWIPSGGYHQYLRDKDAKGQLIALDAKTGRRLWTCPAYEGFDVPVDVMIADGLLWTGRFAWGNDPGITEGRDPKTGEVLRRRPADQKVLPHIGHARCHRVKATTKYLLMGRRGVEFINLKTGDMVASFWVRGSCQYGVMPANGLLYAPPHSCACSVGDLIKSGFIALAPARSNGEEDQEDTANEIRLVKGPVYGQPAARRGPSLRSGRLRAHGSAGVLGDWPTYRHDPARSGFTSAGVPRNLRTTWETKLGSKLTSPVVAAGMLLVAQTDSHRVLALDAATGRTVWSYVADARIDSPPTVDHGRALFGSADGWVYCVRLGDGALVWRFLAAPRERLISVNGQLESPWPVSGSVLVTGGAAYFAAGRSSYIDGGMRLYKLDAATGRTIKVVKLEAGQKKRDGGVASGGYLPDVLSAKDDSIFMRSARFNKDLVRQKDTVAHLWSSVGFLDDDWWHRTYWQIGTFMGSGWGGWPKAGQRVPAGRLLVTDGTRLFGYGRNQYDIPGAHVGIDAEGVWGPIGPHEGRWTFYRMFARRLDIRPGREARRQAERQAPGKPDWTRRIPMLVRAMVLTGQTVFCAGPSVNIDKIPHKPADADPLAAALASKRGGSLLAVSPHDGKTLARYDLQSPPVFDGMIAAEGRLYICCVDGRIVCMGQ